MSVQLMLSRVFGPATFDFVVDTNTLIDSVWHGLFLLPFSADITCICLPTKTQGLNDRIFILKGLKKYR
jgi:hypothetical protein